MGNCNNDKKAVKTNLFQGVHHHKAIKAQPMKINKNGWENEDKLQNNKREKLNHGQDHQKQSIEEEVKGLNLQKRVTEDTIAQKNEKRQSSDSVGSEEVDQCDIGLRGTVVNSVNFELDYEKAKKEAESLGQLQPSSPRKQRKWRNKVAGLSIVSQASQSKQNSSWGSAHNFSTVFKSKTSMHNSKASLNKQ